MSKKEELKTIIRDYIVENFEVELPEPEPQVNDNISLTEVLDEAQEKKRLDKMNISK